MAEKTFKCGFRHCRHESCDVSQGEAVKIKNRYFHEDCAEIYNNIEAVKQLYYEKISNTVVMPQLVSVINNIIFNGFIYFYFFIIDNIYIEHTHQYFKQKY